ncbi:MAG: hypothetical protein ACOYLI_13180 [Synechococcus lacustris]
MAALSHFRRPALLPRHIFCPAQAATGEVLTVGNQALVQLTGEHWNAVRPGMVTKPVAGHADLAATTGHQHLTIEVWPFIQLLN